jgi:hypothetical protein
VALWYGARIKQHVDLTENEPNDRKEFIELRPRMIETKAVNPSLSSARIPLGFPADHRKSALMTLRRRLQHLATLCGARLRPHTTRHIREVALAKSGIDSYANEQCGGSHWSQGETGGPELPDLDDRVEAVAEAHTR